VIKQSCLLLIAFYQRFLSPIKGYNCAHHRLHKGPTCSNAIKHILIDNKLSDVPNLVRERFDECKEASITITKNAAHQKADIPCDISCVGDVGSCGDGGCGGNDSSNSSCSPDELCSLPCDALLEFDKAKRRTKIIIVSLVLIVCLSLAFYYGTRLTFIELTAKPDFQSISVLDRLKKRQSPSLRVVLLGQGSRIESSIFETEQHNSDTPILLELDSAVHLASIRQISIQDARFKAANDLIVVSQKLAFLNWY